MSSSPDPDEQLRRARSEALEQAAACGVAVDDEWLTVTLEDGRLLSTPLSWFPRLVHASREERERWRIIAGGEGIWWDDIDDGVEVAHLLVGWKGGESEASLKRWLEERERAGKKA